tara:strand:- start:403 stop:630 length:228 start_codon:yes stop_codon:yes gene_type:complete
MSDIARMLVSFLLGALISYAATYIYQNYNNADKQYHCHAKKHFLLESLQNNGNVYVKTKPEKFCIDLRDIKRRVK